MSRVLVFDFPLGWQIGLPVAALALGLSAWSLQRRKMSLLRVAALVGFRATVLLPLVFLAARPVWVATEAAHSAHPKVTLLLDRSESMSLVEGGKSRYDQVLDFARQQLLPALKSADQPAQAILFAHEAESADGDKLTGAKPDGKRTNLGGAIVQALANPADPPLAVIGLTDGIANESEDNNRALTALLEAGSPFIGIGFGSDIGAQTLSLRQVDGPALASPKSAFNITASLEAINCESVPAFDLLLLRDGQACQQKSVQPGKGSRMWLENFRVIEDAEGVHNYEVRLMPPSAPAVKCVNVLGNAAVRISNEKELRILYIQGALTWDYKFIAMALRNDPTMKMTGLTRTSKQSIFRQNVESSGELINGFPTTLEEIAPFRVIVLSNIRPSDMTLAQQEVLGRFCGELGGGLLMMGGPETFDGSWQGSRLEQLLPVVFATRSGVQGLDRPFRMQLTEEALQQAVFQVADDRPAREVWAQLPTFTQYGRVDSAKPGAHVWAEHQTDEGPIGRRILIASQPYGAGQSAIICIQNFWRWRLAKDSEPQQFDRFWRQLFRYLANAGTPSVAIHLADQDLHPGMDVQVILEKQPDPKTVTDARQKFGVRVESGVGKILLEQTVNLDAGRPYDFTFRADEPGTYTVSVLDEQKVSLASRAVTIRENNVEFENTGRDMETLKQWASVSGGLAFKAEDCPNGRDLVQQIKQRILEAQRSRTVRQPAGMNGWMLLVLLGSLAAEWILRKRWGLA